MEKATRIENILKNVSKRRQEKIEKEKMQKKESSKIE